MANFNINTAGFCIIALFAGIWTAARDCWRFGRVEAPVDPGPAEVMRRPGRAGTGEGRCTWPVRGN